MIPHHAALSLLSVGSLLNTPFGHVRHVGSEYELGASRRQIETWVTRPGSAWPCSTLLDVAPGWARFESRSGDLVDLCARWMDADLAGHEVTAWQSDVLDAALHKLRERTS